jgi:hypothetical protein
MSQNSKNFGNSCGVIFTSLKMLTLVAFFALVIVGTAEAQLARGNEFEEGDETTESEAPIAPFNIDEGPSIPTDISVPPLPSEEPPTLTTPLDNMAPLVEEETPESTEPTIVSPENAVGMPEEEEPALTTYPAREPLDFPWSNQPAPTGTDMMIPQPPENGLGGDPSLSSPTVTVEPPSFPTMETVPPTIAPLAPTVAESTVGVVQEETLPPGGIAVDPNDDVITQLKKERFNESLRLYQALEVEIRQGLAGLDDLVRAHRALMIAQLALTDSPQERIDIRQAYLDACLRCEQEAQTKYVAGLGNATSLQLATMERTNAELDLEQEREQAIASSIPTNPYGTQPNETMPSTTGVPTISLVDPETIAPGVASPTESPTYYGPGNQSYGPAVDSIGSNPSASNTGAPCPCETQTYGSPHRSGAIYYSPSRTRIRTWEQRVIGW